MELEEIEQQLEEIVARGSPGEVVSLSKTINFITDEHVSAVQTTIDYFEAMREQSGMKEAFMTYLDKYVSTAYMMKVFTFAVNSYKGVKITDEERAEITDKIREKAKQMEM